MSIFKKTGFEMQKNLLLKLIKGTTDQKSLILALACATKQYENLVPEDVKMANSVAEKMLASTVDACSAYDEYRDN